MDTSSATYRVDADYESPDTLILRFSGIMKLAYAGDILKSMRQHLDKNNFSFIKVDISGVKVFDASAAAIIIDIMHESLAGNYGFSFVGDTKKFDEFLFLLDLNSFNRSAWEPKRDRSSIFTHLGDEAVRFFHDAKNTVAFLGGILTGMFGVIKRPKEVRWSETFYFMEQAGANALPIVALISFLIGFIMAFQSAGQLQQYGAQIYIANLVGLIVVRELGPVLTAIIIAGRSGCAFTAEIGTMKVSEEINALSVMGFSVFGYLIAPKIIALNLMLPALTILADIIGMFGGLIVGVTKLNLSYSQYIHQTYIAIGMSDIAFGLIKSMVFGVLIAGIGCYRGMLVSGGADSVGRQTTSSIVTSIFAIIITDAVFAVLCQYVPWF